jgi:hypothetical protein
VEDAPEIDQRYKGEVCTHEDEVGLPLEVVDEGWCDHHHDEILRVLLVGGFQMVMWMRRLTQSQFEDMPIAVPFALACRGRISGTYTLGIVNFS